MPVPSVDVAIKSASDTGSDSTYTTQGGIELYFAPKPPRIAAPTAFQQYLPWGLTAAVVAWLVWRFSK